MNNSFVEITDVRDGLYTSLRKLLLMFNNTLTKENFKVASNAILPVAELLNTSVDDIYYNLLDTMKPRCELPLMSGCGNFGFCPAAPMFTQIYPSEFFYEVVGTQQRIDGDQPLVMPVPYSLVAGTIGTYESETKIPSHNLAEVIDAAIALINNPNIETSDLLNYIKGPDLLVGGMIENPENLCDIYESGKGVINVIITPDNINCEYRESVIDYCDSYGYKVRKLPVVEKHRIKVQYNAFFYDGNKERYMSLKEILQQYIDYIANYTKKSCGNDTDYNKMCNILMSYRNKSTSRRTILFA